MEPPRNSVFLPADYEAMTAVEAQELAGYVSGVAGQLRRWRAEGIGDRGALTTLERDAEQALLALHGAPGGPRAPL